MWVPALQRAVFCFYKKLKGGGKMKFSRSIPVREIIPSMELEIWQGSKPSHLQLDLVVWEDRGGNKSDDTVGSSFEEYAQFHLNFNIHMTDRQSIKLVQSAL